jgi:uncharacterized protein YbdZ (MbtH family)
MDDDTLENATYHVVINHEEQYSIWMDGRDIPPGWRAVGKSGPKVECLDYINQVWTDMRPLSLRKKMEELQRMPPREPPPAPADPGPSLVTRLSSCDQEAEVWLGGDAGFDEFRKCVERKYVHIRFPGTRGGTTLGFHLDEERSQLSGGALANREGAVQLIGELTLDYVRCRCVADIDLATLKGTGHLEVIETANRDQMAGPRAQQ